MKVSGSVKRGPALMLAEPPAMYLARPPLVVDCSVLSAALFEESMRDEAMNQLAGRMLHAPTLLDHEIASVAAKKARLGWPAAAVQAALADYALQSIELHRTDVQAQVALAQRYEISTYDAAYLWLAADLKVPLVTFDRKLGEVAQAHLGALE